jgi:hypothetical protein
MTNDEIELLIYAGIIFISAFCFSWLLDKVRK